MRDGGLVSGAQDRRVRKWEAATGAMMWSSELSSEVNGVAELTNGQLVVGCDDGSVKMIDGADGRAIRVCVGHTRLVVSVISLGALNAGSFASVASDMTIRVWASDGTPVRVVNARHAWNLSPSPRGTMVAVGYYEGTVILHRLPDWDELWSVRAHRNAVTGMSWSPTRPYLALGSRDKSIKIISTTTGAILRTHTSHLDYVRCVSFSRDGSRIYSGSFDKTVRAWRIFWGSERKVWALCAGLEGAHDHLDGLHEVVVRMKRSWEVEE